MKKILIIARHSHAADSRPGQPDKERPLTQTGISEAHKTADWLKEQQIKPDVILVSPAVRTRQTAAVYAEKLTGSAVNLRIEHFLYAASEKDIADFIKENTGKENIVMVVGHNPAVSGLAGIFSNRTVSYLTPAGVVIFQLKENAWQELKLKPLSLIADLHATS